MVQELPIGLSALSAEREFSQMSKGRSDQNSGTAGIPFRVLPSHGPRLAWVLLALLIGAAVIYFVLGEDPDFSRAVADGVGLPDNYLPYAYGVILLLVVALGYARERLYFRPGSSY